MVALDAAPEPPDAAPPIDAAPAAAPGDGTLIVLNDTWCDILVDGLPAGRTGAGHRKELKVAAGQHVVTCQQPAGTWTKTIVVVAGQPAAVQDALLRPVAVTMGISGDKIQIDGRHYPRGAKAQLKAGRYRAVVPGGAAGWLTVPQVAACTVHEVGNDLACDP
ncbi:MAG: hypothetical protein KIT31_35650 [Deltaproteobacteria bacterium]|nr:hypothetical protein [Deltaproteobacteria bacterium]